MLAIFIQLFFLSLFAVANPGIKFKQLSIDEGLRNNRVIAVLQDSAGYLWFATHGGVEKFTGNTMQHYSFFQEDNLFAGDNVVNAMTYNAYFDVLCGTRNGNVYAYQRNKDAFKRMVSNSQADSLFNITSVYAKSEHDILIGCGAGLFILETNVNKLTQIKGVEFGVSFIKQYKSSLIVGTINGLYHLNKETLFVKKLRVFSKDFDYSNEEFLSFCLKDTLIVTGTRKADIITFSLADIEAPKLKSVKRFKIGTSLLPVSDLEYSPEGFLLVALDGYGIIKLDEENNIIEQFIANVNDPNSLSSNSVYDLFYSKENILWVATYGGGLNYYDPNIQRFTVVKHQPFVYNSLRDNFVKAILETNNNDLWIGTKSGVSILNIANNKWSHFPGLNEEFINFHVMDMQSDINGDVWIATYGSGLKRYSSGAGLIEEYNKTLSGSQNTATDHLYTVHIDKLGRIWAGGIWGKTTVIDVTKNTNHKVNVSNVRCIIEFNNSIYMGTLFGLFVVDMKTLNVLRPRNEALLSSKIISMAKEPEDHIIYIGTESNGLIAYDIIEDKVTKIDVRSGLQSDYIRSLCFDNNRELWIGSTNGLICYSLSDTTFEHFGLSDGIASKEFNENSAYKTASGDLLFGGPKGITKFNPKEIKRSAIHAVPVFTGLKIFGEDISISDDGPLKKNLNMVEKINFPYNQNSISLSFDAIMLSNPQNIKFMWKMEGYEDNWNGPTQIREAIYSKIPPGEYIFRVKASGDNLFTATDKSLYLVVEKPFLLQPWAYLIYIILLAGVIYFTFTYYNILVHERHSKEKQQFFISIAHDLRTPLSLVKLPIEKMMGEYSSKSIDDNNLMLIRKNVDRLTNLVNQLLDFQKADLRKMKLQVSQNELIKFVAERINAFKPLYEEKEITVSFNHPDKPIDIWFDKNKMEKVMYNLLSNAFKYTQKQGKVLINIRDGAKSINISVKDNGEGIPASQQKNIFKRFYRASNAINSQEVGSGVGLVLTKQIIEMHKGVITFTSELGKGSEFSFQIPKNKSAFTKEELHFESSEQTERIPVMAQKISEDVDRNNDVKILIVEDNIELLESLSQELNRQYQVVKATNGKEAIEKLENFMPELIISDVMMPEMNGHQLCLQVKNNVSFCHIPVILLTALDSPDYKREGLEHGADAYLEKPFDLKLLYAQIENLLQNRKILKSKFLQPSTQFDEVSPSSKDQMFLEKFQQHVINNIDNDDLSVENTAKELGMSRPVLYRKIKAITDLSPQQFLMTIKLREAIRIMKEEDKNISETAYIIGFTDPKYFSQIFKKYFGVTPSRYLKSS